MNLCPGTRCSEIQTPRTIYSMFVSLRCPSPHAQSSYRLIAYTFDLKHHFCRSAETSISEECDAWRKRALELEAKLHARWPTATPEDVGTGLLILCLIHLTGMKESLAKKGVPEHTPLISKRKGKQTKKPPKTLEGRRPQTLEIPSTATSKLRDVVSPHNSAFLFPPHNAQLDICALGRAIKALNVDE